MTANRQKDIKIKTFRTFDQICLNGSFASIFTKAIICCVIKRCFYDGSGILGLLDSSNCFFIFFLLLNLLLRFLTRYKFVENWLCRLSLPFVVAVVVIVVFSISFSLLWPVLLCVVRCAPEGSQLVSLHLFQHLCVCSFFLFVFFVLL